MLLLSRDIKYFISTPKKCTELIYIPTITVLYSALAEL